MRSFGLHLLNLLILRCLKVVMVVSESTILERRVNEHIKKWFRRNKLISALNGNKIKTLREWRVIISSKEKKLPKTSDLYFVYVVNALKQLVWPTEWYISTFLFFFFFLSFFSFFGYRWMKYSKVYMNFNALRWQTIKTQSCISFNKYHTTLAKSKISWWNFKNR